MISIKDIAKAAGVSHPTVSRALRDSPLVSADTKARIKRLAVEMGYSPDARARSLVRGSTQTVGVVVTTIADPFVAQVVEGIEDAAQKDGYTVILCNSHSDPEREISAVEALRSKRVDGVVVTSSRVGALYLDHLERIGVPVVLINNHNERSGSYTYSVSVDNRHGGHLATEHLLQLGHRRIAYVSGPADHSDDLDRLAGYRQALDQAGIPFEASLVVAGTGRADGGERALPDLMALEAPPTAVFCYNDMTAIGLMRAAAAVGISIPADLAVVGFDDIPFASYVRPPLSTIAQPKVRMGVWAMEMVVALIATSSPLEDQFSNRVLEGQLIVRESTEATPGRDLVDHLS
jgi:DNA-binding LacI/PurR family transcriptional regulator